MIKKVRLTSIMLLLSFAAQAQMMEKIKSRSGGDPAIPTSLFTRYDSHFDLRFDSQYYYIGNLWSLAYAFNPKHQVSANALLAFSSESNTLGIGDIEVGYSSMPLIDTTSFLSALGYRIEFLIPTGNYDKSLGIGAIRVSPSIIANLAFNDLFFILPELQYIFTSKVLQEVPSSQKNNATHGLGASLKFIFKPTISSWIWLTPAFINFDISDSNPDFELELLYGVKLLNRIGLSASFKRNFTTNGYDFQFINSIYF